MEKLTEEQIGHWRKALIHTLGPYALLMPDEQIQLLFERMQNGLTHAAPYVCLCGHSEKEHLFFDDHSECNLCQCENGFTPVS